MLLIPCPWCGPREAVEFRYGGEAHLVRNPGPQASDDEWAAYLYLRTNPRGGHVERWRHAHGCGQFFNVARHTLTDAISRSYAAGDPRPAPEDAA